MSEWCIMEKFETCEQFLNPSDHSGNQFDGMLIRRNNHLQLLSQSEAVEKLGLKPHAINLNYKLSLSLNLDASVIMERLHTQLSSIISGIII